MFAGIGLFSLVYFAPAFPDAVDPSGNSFGLSAQGKGALALFLLAGTWWVFEVIPIGVTSLVIGTMQALFLIRSADDAFKDFMDPSVMFIFASIVIGMVFTKTGLTRRMTYRMLQIVGERTSMIMLGCFVVTAALTHVMAHTAVAATMFPILLAIHALYDEKQGRTAFGKSLFMGMAYVAGAGSIVTLLGAARGAVALSFYQKIVGEEIGFFQLTYYMLPIGWIMVFLLWFFFMALSKPERDRIPGLRNRVAELRKQQGSISTKEILAATIVIGMIVVLSLRPVLPFPPHKTAVILTTTVLFFIFRILDVEDLEEVPWNIILLFGGAMSMGYCLWQTGAAEWLAVNCLSMIEEAPAFVFVLCLSVFVLLMTNFIMNVAAIAISLPVALRIAPELGVSSEVIVFSSLVVAGMPFLLLVGAAPNAIAYESKQFTSGEFFRYGMIASVVLMVIVALAIGVLWPMMGMSLTI
jgi:solute carrier family 13 (sodium-dependent dicarboxylate transporter), member 2/3/5